MSRSIEVQGVTVDEAIQQALNSLGVGRDSVEIQILHHPRSGFLGIGARRAKVRATLREQVMADGEEFDMSPAERRSRGRRRRRPRRRSGSDESSADSSSQRSSESPSQGRTSDSQKQRDSKSQGRRSDQRSRRESRDRDSPAAGDRGQSNRKNEQDGAQQGQETGQSRQDEGQNKRERGRDGQRGRGGRGRRERGPRNGGNRRSAEDQTPSTAADDSRSNRPAATESSPAPAATTDRAPEPSKPQAPAAETLSSAAVLARAQELVGELARRMGFEAEIGGHIDEQAEEAVVEVKADAEGLLIGRRGQTLDALEHVVNRMVVGYNQAAEVRVALDVGGYRERRRESLVDLAGRLRERALSEKRRVQVSPMSARDRRIFQAALADDEGISTRVLGSGFYRRLLVIPVGVEDDGSAPAESSAETETGEGDGDATG
jgi:spoIIIJ-associated protein